MNSHNILPVIIGGLIPALFCNQCFRIRDGNQENVGATILQKGAASCYAAPQQGSGGKIMDEMGRKRTATDESTGNRTDKADPLQSCAT